MNLKNKVNCLTAISIPLTLSLLTIAFFTQTAAADSKTGLESNSTQLSKNTAFPQQDTVIVEIVEKRSDGTYQVVSRSEGLLQSRLSGGYDCGKLTHDDDYAYGTCTLGDNVSVRLRGDCSRALDRTLDGKPGLENERSRHSNPVSDFTVTVEEAFGRCSIYKVAGETLR